MTCHAQFKTWRTYVEICARRLYDQYINNGSTHNVPQQQEPLPVSSSLSLTMLKTPNTLSISPKTLVSNSTTTTTHVMDEEKTSTLVPVSSSTHKLLDIANELIHSSSDKQTSSLLSSQSSLIVTVAELPTTLLLPSLKEECDDLMDRLNPSSDIQQQQINRLITILYRCRDGDVDGTRCLTPEQIVKEYNQSSSSAATAVLTSDILRICRSRTTDIFIIDERLPSKVFISLHSGIRPVLSSSISDMKQQQSTMSLSDKFSDNVSTDIQSILRIMDKIFDILSGKYRDYEKGASLTFGLLRKMYSDRFKETLQPSNDLQLTHLIHKYAADHIRFTSDYEILPRERQRNIHMAVPDITNEQLCDRIIKIIDNIDQVPLSPSRIYQEYTRR